MLTVGVFLVGALLLWRAQDTESRRVLEGLREERGALVARIFEMRGGSLRTFGEDYSFWDDMVAFVRSGAADREWAKINLEASLDNFDAHGIWVLAGDHRQIYASIRGLDASLATLPVEASALRPRLEADRFLHFFVDLHGTLLEFRTAPVQPSDDLPRTSPAQGWVVVARLWDGAEIKHLAGIVGGVAHLQTPDAGRRLRHDSADASSIHSQIPLPGLDGSVTAFLCADYEPTLLLLLREGAAAYRALFLGFGILLIIGATVAVYRWVVRPLRQLERSLALRSTEALGSLAKQPDVLGRLAALAEESFAHRESLQREVEERRRAEAELTQSREQLRQAAELRSRLARDLHDGVIQSIYATGLGLASLRETLRENPQGAERRIETATASLNQTIREVRSFINGLEPESGQRTDFQQSLEALVSTLRTLNPIAIDLRVDAGALRLTEREELHSLQIVRECVSNAMRHGRAQEIGVAIQAEGNRPVLQVHDNGRGFDAASLVRGSGLNNISSRAAEVGAELSIESEPGKGTEVRLRFAPR